MYLFRRVLSLGSHVFLDVLRQRHVRHALGNVRVHHTGLVTPILAEKVGASGLSPHAVAGGDVRDDDGLFSFVPVYTHVMCDAWYGMVW